MSVIATVVLFNPNLALLKRLYKSLYHQVDSIIFSDNSEDNSIKEDVKNWINQLIQSDIIYLDLHKNHGIAYAQNRGIEVAKECGARFVLLLDQDSALPNTMVSDLISVYERLLHTNHKVATVGPSFLDEKSNVLARIIRYDKIGIQKIIPDESKDFERAHHIISSGSLIPIKVLNEVGMMKESLFIDMVDTEWCIRAKLYGYDSFVAPKTIMRHSIGDEFVSVGQRKVNLHSDFRNYFIIRNSVYVILYERISLNFRIAQLLRVPLHILFYSYHSKRRLYSLGLLTKAVIDGILKNMGKGHFK